MKKILTLILLNIALILLVDSFSPNEDVGVRKCFRCDSSLKKDCTAITARAEIKCPLEQAYCGVLATAPTFIPHLTCSRNPVKNCTLVTDKKNYILICGCDDKFCNMPMDQELQLNLIAFYERQNTNMGLNISEEYWNLQEFASYTGAKLHKAVAFNFTAIDPRTHPPIYIIDHDEYTVQAAALQQDSTFPSDDDEDENEGSGLFEETRAQAPNHVPEQPSSVLPPTADPNYAPSTYTINLLPGAILFLILN